MKMVSALKQVGLVAALLVTANAAYAQQKQEIMIGLSSSGFTTAAPRLVQQMKIFEKYGIDAKFTILDGSTAALAGLMGGSVDIIGAGPADFMAAHARNDNVVLIDSMYTGFGTSMVVSKTLADKIGVSPTAPLNERLKALKGYKIATVAATSVGTFPFKVALQALNIDQPMTYIGQPAMQSAMESQAIDGYVSGAPFWALPIVKGTGVLWISGPKGELPPDATPNTTGVLLTTRAYAAANPDVIKKLRAGLADLAKAVRERPSDVKAAALQLYPTMDAAAFDVLVAAEMKGWDITPLTAKALAREIAIVKAAGIPFPEGAKLDPARMVAP